MRASQIAGVDAGVAIAQRTDAGVGVIAHQISTAEAIEMIASAATNCEMNAVAHG